MLYPAAKVVLFNPEVPGKLLLIFRDVHGAVGHEAAGGRVEVNFESRTAENFEICAIREIKEEVGVDVELIDYLGSYSFFWDTKENCCSSCVVFLGKVIGGIVGADNPDKDEFDLEPRWVDISEIINGSLSIRNSHAGLKPLLMKAVTLLNNI